METEALNSSVKISIDNIITWKGSPLHANQCTFPSVAVLDSILQRVDRGFSSSFQLCPECSSSSPCSSKMWHFLRELRWRFATRKPCTVQELLRTIAPLIVFPRFCKDHTGGIYTSMVELTLVAFHMITWSDCRRAVDNVFPRRSQLEVAHRMRREVEGVTVSECRGIGISLPHGRDATWSRGSTWYGATIQETPGLTLQHCQPHRWQSQRRLGTSSGRDGCGRRTGSWSAHTSTCRRSSV